MKNREIFAEEIGMIVKIFIFLLLISNADIFFCDLENVLCFKCKACIKGEGWGIEKHAYSPMCDTATVPCWLESCIDESFFSVSGLFKKKKKLNRFTHLQT